MPARPRPVALPVLVAVAGVPAALPTWAPPPTWARPAGAGERPARPRRPLKRRHHTYLGERPYSAGADNAHYPFSGGGNGPDTERQPAVVLGGWRLTRIVWLPHGPGAPA